MNERHLIEREQAVRALIAKRRQTGSDAGMAQQSTNQRAVQSSISDQERRVKELLDQRRRVESSVNAGKNLQVNTHHSQIPAARQDLMSPDSSVSFEFDRAATRHQSVHNPPMAGHLNQFAGTINHDKHFNGQEDLRHVVREIFPDPVLQKDAGLQGGRIHQHSSNQQPQQQQSKSSQQASISNLSDMLHKYATMSMDNDEDQLQLLDELQAMLRQDRGAPVRTRTPPGTPAALRQQQEQQQVAKQRPQQQESTTQHVQHVRQSHDSPAAQQRDQVFMPGGHVGNHPAEGQHVGPGQHVNKHRPGQQGYASIHVQQQHQQRASRSPAFPHEQHLHPQPQPPGRLHADRAQQSNPHSQHAGVIGNQQSQSAHQDDQQPKKSLAELEERLAQLTKGMNVTSALHQQLMSGQSLPDGPFDISSLWYGGGSQAESVVTQSDADHGGDGRNTHDDGDSHAQSQGNQSPSHQQLLAQYQSLLDQHQAQQEAKQQQQPAVKKSKKAPSRPASAGRGRAPAASAAGRPASARGYVPQHSSFQGIQSLEQQYQALQNSTKSVATSVVNVRASGRPRPQSAPRAGGRAGAAGGAAMMRSSVSSFRSEAAPFLVAAPWQEFSFKPRINENSKRMIEASYPKDREARIAQLAVPKAVTLQKYEQVRRELEDQELQECTFVPKTGRPPSPLKLPRDGPVYDRLYQQQPTWLHTRGEILASREMAALEECTFKPTVSKGTQRRCQSAGRGRQPIHERVQDVLRNKNENLANTRIRMELCEDGITFRPAINPKSVAMAERLKEAKGVAMLAPGERLYTEAQVTKHIAAMRAREKAEDSQCTFAPAINERSKRLLQTSEELPATFLQRQEYLAALAAEKKALYSRAVEEAQTRPASRPASRSVTPRSRSDSWTSEDLEGVGSDRIAKLAYADVRRSMALKDALANHYYGQFPFQPEINPKSRVIGSAHTVEDLYRNEKGQQKRERVAQAVKESRVEDCTFKPNLNPLSLKLAAMRRTGSVLDTATPMYDPAQMAKEVRLQEARAMKEYEELAECTFTPHINRQQPATAASKVDISQLPGVGKFLDMKDLAKRKQEEEDKRKEKVWWQRPKGSAQLFTVPQPFSFEDREAAAEQERVEQEYMRLAELAAREDAEAEARLQARRVAAGAQNRQAIHHALNQAELLAYATSLA